jgi:hypothetical protein
LTAGGFGFTDSQAYVVDENGERTTPLRRSQLDGTTVRIGNESESTTTVLGVPFFRNIAKIEIANNVANYRDSVAAGGLAPEQLRSLLVPSSNDPAANTIAIGTATISGLAGISPSSDTPGAGRLSLSGFAPVPVPMSQTFVATTASSEALASTRGIGLKLLAFEVNGDQTTVVWSDSLNFGRVPKLPPPVQGTDGGSAFFSGATILEPIAAPLNGVFNVRIPDQIRRTYDQDDVTKQEVIDAVFTLRQLPGQLSGYAQVTKVHGIDSTGQEVSLSGSPPPAGAGITNVRALEFVDSRASQLLVDQVTSLRFNGAVSVGRAGSATAVTVTAVPFADPPGALPLLVDGRLRTPNIVSISPLPRFIQTANNSVEPTGFLTPNISTGYALSGAVADSSASLSFDPGQRGTRVLIFDKAIDTQSGRANGDSAGGVWLPGFGGITGTNNSTTGLPSLGPSFGPPLGTSGQVAIRPGSSSDLPRAPLINSVIADRATQDADMPRPGSYLAEAREGIVIGGRPSMQADLGRSGSGGGAAIDVFRQRFQMATSGDSSVCNPDAIQPSDARSRDTQVRDCQATQKQR